MKAIKICSLLVLPLVAVLTLTGCEKHHKTVKHHVKHETVKLEKLKPAGGQKDRYAYRDDDGFWWYYIILMNNNSSSSSSSSYSYPSSSGGRVTLPAGGSWSRSSTAPKAEEVEEGQ